ncbi:hypothetical protein GLOIN_2v1574152 [Rhizophagus clarus]|uniref:Uncharacterized protein n=1 Tax=Rhizophagus clarus TaxID=94130 RepID=A0A8H3KN10_9GLOM|nr:hypothetical protein GLOIN_2v1574152 [Rhizophagus clarus]
MVLSYIVTLLIRLVGFGVGGIVKGSLAALIMASYAGQVAVGSACALLQSAGALGVAGLGGLIDLLFRLFQLMIFCIFRI